LRPEVPQLGDLGASDIGDDYAMIGDYPKAIDWPARAYDLSEFVLFTVPYDATIAPAFFRTAEWRALWQRPLIKDWQTIHDAITRDLAAKPG
jgi:hypothetical protein